MDKGTPHTRLVEVFALLDAGKIQITFSALAGAAALGLDASGIVQVVRALTTKDFHKSMTTYADHSTWQDVYRPSTAVGEVYVKLMVSDGVLVVSFKEL
ncbi:MAG: type II toxin-antitoxin system MqsR family toxin [Stagnimonas sp.]|nr:type II toxin-antitoxin system MqsR family toxin [Stagnimonas sp.]